MRALRRFLLLLIILAGSTFILVFLYRHQKRPELVERTQIYKGIYYQCVDLPGNLPGHGRVMVVEVQLLAPGVEVLLRPFDHDLIGDGAHYRLTYGDLEIRRYDLPILLNGVRYEQAEWWQSIPGLPKAVHETIVIDGQASHRHEHSYLLWCDENAMLTMEKTKPPSAYALENAVWALGIQGITVSDGKVSNHLQKHPPSDVIPITFVGIDPSRSNLWLIAFEGTTELGMAQFAADLGVRDGGMLDSGDATTLIIGKGAKGPSAYTGIRGARPLASWIGVRAEEIDR